ncbi:MAG: gliding motility protein GldC [Flavobacteriales bacterium]
MSKEQIKSTISLHVTLDENRVPETINWDATDGGVQNKPANAILLSVWDPAEQNTLRVDLWTKEMMVDDMKKFFHQTIMLMADTLDRSTGETKMAETMRDFGDYFAEKMELLPPKEK